MKKRGETGSWPVWEEKASILLIGHESACTYSQQIDTRIYRTIASSERANNKFT